MDDVKCKIVLYRIGKGCEPIINIKDWFLRSKVCHGQSEMHIECYCIIVW
uniref:Uncharacterized protein n=1 Tax=Anguilla anguilla TaxID=7936 RepID=A0A0E9WNV8_ANGAN